MFGEGIWDLLTQFGTTKLILVSVCVAKTENKMSKYSQKILKKRKGRETLIPFLSLYFSTL